MGRDSACSPRALGPLLARWQSTLGNSLGNPHIIQHHLSEMIGPTVQSCKAHWNISKEHLETFILQFQNTPIPAVLKEQSIFLIQQLKKKCCCFSFPHLFFYKTFYGSLAGVHQYISYFSQNTLFYHKHPLQIQIC